MDTSDLNRLLEELRKPRVVGLTTYAPGGADILFAVRSDGAVYVLKGQTWQKFAPVPTESLGD